VTAFETWHVGAWTARGAGAGEPGRLRTADELNLDIVGLARLLGRPDPPSEQQVILPRPGTRLFGVHSLADAEEARRLQAMADAAFDWIATRAPAGYRFVRTDAVRLEPVDDLAAPVVAIEAVTARADGVPAPLAATAASHVRRSGTGWVAGDVARIWAGPFDTRAEALAAVESARADLARWLHDHEPTLSATADRWPPIPSER
jgi:hypothetical protein